MDSSRQIARILILDDEETILTALQFAFDGLDWIVDLATTAEDALRQLREHEYDVLLVDKNLPGMDGVSLIEQVRQENIGVRIIMMTGYGSLSSAVATANLGIDAYLVKPFPDIYQVRDTVARCLDRQERKRRARSRIAQLTARASAAGEPSMRPSARASMRPPAQQPSPVPSHGSRPEAGMSLPPSEREQMRVLIITEQESVRRKLRLLLDSTPAATAYAMPSENPTKVVERHKPDAVLVQGEGDLVPMVSSIGRAAPDVVMIVASESLDIASVRKLIDLEVTAVITDATDTPEFQKRVRQLLRWLNTRLRLS